MKKVQNFLLILPIESGIIKVVQKHAPVCRNGRRGGLKIPCANNTCGFDPHHRHKKEAPPACLGEFSFLSAACERVEQHGPALQGERSALRAVAQCAGDPHHRHCKQLEIERFWAVFLFLLSFLYFGVFWEDIDDCIHRGHLTGEIQMCMDLKRIIPPFKTSPRRLPSILTITITAESKRKQNGCLPSKFREASMMDS